jgi:hypothetical protein
MAASTSSCGLPLEPEETELYIGDIQAWDPTKRSPSNQPPPDSCNQESVSANPEEPSHHAHVPGGKIEAGSRTVTPSKM